MATNQELCVDTRGRPVPCQDRRTAFSAPANTGAWGRGVRFSANGRASTPAGAPRVPPVAGGGSGDGGPNWKALGPVLGAAGAGAIGAGAYAYSRKRKRGYSAVATEDPNAIEMEEFARSRADIAEVERLSSATNAFAPPAPASELNALNEMVGEVDQIGAELSQPASSRSSRAASIRSSRSAASSVYYDARESIASSRRGSIAPGQELTNMAAGEIDPDYPDYGPFVDAVEDEEDMEEFRRRQIAANEQASSASTPVVGEQIEMEELGGPSPAPKRARTSAGGTARNPFSGLIDYFRNRSARSGYDAVGQDIPMTAARQRFEAERRYVARPNRSERVISRDPIYRDVEEGWISGARRELIPESVRQNGLLDINSPPGARTGGGDDWNTQAYSQLMQRSGAQAARMRGDNSDDFTVNGVVRSALNLPPNERSLEMTDMAYRQANQVANMRLSTLDTDVVSVALLDRAAELRADARRGGRAMTNQEAYAAARAELMNAPQEDILEIQQRGVDIPNSYEQANTLIERARDDPQRNENLQGHLRRRAYHDDWDGAPRAAGMPPPASQNRDRQGNITAAARSGPSYKQHRSKWQAAGAIGLGGAVGAAGGVARAATLAAISGEELTTEEKVEAMRQGIRQGALSNAAMEGISQVRSRVHNARERIRTWSPWELAGYRPTEEYNAGAGARGRRTFDQWADEELEQWKVPDFIKRRMPGARAPTAAPAADVAASAARAANTTPAPRPPTSAASMAAKTKKVALKTAKGGKALASAAVGGPVGLLISMAIGAAQRSKNRRFARREDNRDEQSGGDPDAYYVGKYRETYRPRMQQRTGSELASDSKNGTDHTTAGRAGTSSGEMGSTEWTTRSAIGMLTKKNAMGRSLDRKSNRRSSVGREGRYYVGKFRAENVKRQTIRQRKGK